MREIGQRHGWLCQYIERYTHTHGWPPSRRDMQQALGLTSTSHVAYYLEALEQHGYLHCQPHISRGVTLTPAGYALAAQAAETPSVQQRALNPRAQRSGKGHKRFSHPPKPHAPA